MTAKTDRPCILEPARSPKAWGTELWLTSTRPEAEAKIVGSDKTLASLIRERPEVLGRWARLLYGDETPIFIKTIVTSFPPRVHMGFCRDVEERELLSWLETEQSLLRELLAALEASTEAAFAQYQARYEAWATRQALEGWRLQDDAATARELSRFCAPAFPMESWLGRVRYNRAAFVASLNEVDLRREAGNLLLSPAGLIHAIFGLSHQTHPLDHTRSALEGLFAKLEGLCATGEPDESLERAILGAGLVRLRLQNDPPPKNEAWLPLLSGADGAVVLVEPQQTSDTTYSLADFYTPLVWGQGSARFRKGSPTSGLAKSDLVRFVAGIDRLKTPVDALRRRLEKVSHLATAGVELMRLVDEPVKWPFFSAYELHLEGSLSVLPAEGVFQQIVVTKGRLTLSDEQGLVGELSPAAPGFVPGTLARPYRLSAHEPSTLLLFGVPGARGGAPRVFG